METNATWSSKLRKESERALRRHTTLNVGCMHSMEGRDNVLASSSEFPLCNQYHLDLAWVQLSELVFIQELMSCRYSDSLAVAVAVSVENEI